MANAKKATDKKKAAPAKKAPAPKAAAKSKPIKFGGVPPKGGTGGGG